VVLMRGFLAFLVGFAGLFVLVAAAMAMVG
jgi:hypothetical protein